MVKEINLNLKAYLDKVIVVKLNGNRRVQGTLRGYDQLMNIVLENASEIISEDDTHEMGKVVFFLCFFVFHRLGYSRQQHYSDGM